MSEFEWTGNRLMGYPLQFATIDGPGELVPASVNTEAIIVLGYLLNVDRECHVAFEQTREDTDPLPAFNLSETGGASYAGGALCPAFLLADRSGLRITCTKGATVTGHLTYVVVA